MVLPVHGLALARDLAPVHDGWANLATGLGDPRRDKRRSSALDGIRLTYADCSNLYRGDKMAAKVIDIPAAEMVREWFDVLVEGDTQKKGEAIEKRLKELGAKSAFKQAIIWAREFGGAGIVVGADDGAKNAAEPLDPAKVKSVDWLTVVDSQELLPAAWYTDISAPKYGQPMVYRLMPRLVSLPQLATVTMQVKKRESEGIFKSFGGISYVHESRVLPFYGVRLSRNETLENLGWGDTVYNRIYSVIQDFASAFDSVAYTLLDFAQGVLKMKGLAAAIAAKGSDTITKRLIAMNLSKAVAKTLLIDAEGEEFKREALSFGSIPETLDRYCNLFASVADMPVTLLMGQAPAGLNATGDSDIRWFYDHISHKQEEEVIPPAERLVKMLFATVGGEPKNWSIQCRSLWQLDEVQESARRKNIAEADVAYVNAGVVTAEEVAVTRFGGDEYNAGKVQLTQGMDTVEKRALAAEEQAEAEAERLAQQAPPDPQGGQPPAKKKDGPEGEKP